MSEHRLPVESVWDYPRPPRVERCAPRLRVVFASIIIADTIAGWRVLETSHPPTYYIPQSDIHMEYLKANQRQTYCEFKGTASYWTLSINDRQVPNAAWSYPHPNKGYEEIRDHLAFYASKVDACYVGDELVQAQEGDFYGGWITSNLRGPFKGGPGTLGW